MLELESIESAIRVLLYSREPDQATQLVGKLRTFIEKAEVATHARLVRALLPELDRMEPFGNYTSGDNGRFYMEWFKVDLALQDGRQVAMNDAGLIESGEFLYENADDNAAHLARRSALEKAGSTRVEADRQASAEALGLSPDRVEDVMRAIWNLVEVVPGAEDQVLTVKELLRPV